MDATQRERSSRKVRPGNWLRIALFNLVFIVVPLGIYFVFYVDSRIEQITVRNFRALDAASERLRVVIDNLPKVAGNVPVGLSSAALSQARRVLREAAPSTGQSELAAELAAARSRRAVAQRRVEALSREASVPRSKSSLQSLLDEVRQQQAAVVGDLRRAQAELRRSDDELADLERRLRYASGEADCLDSSAIRDLVGLDATYSAYLEDFRSVPGATGFQVGALKRRAPAAATGDACAEAASKELRRQLDRALVTTATCEHEGVRRRLILQRPEGIGLEVRDCQPFDRRAEALSRAIATEALRGVLDEYGVRIFSRLDTIVAGVAANVAPLFDQYLITDANGRVLYAASSGGGASRVDDVVGTPNGRNVRVDFVSQVDLGALVRNEARSASSALDDSLDALGARAGGSDDRPWVRYGVHSRLETISVADITFNVFVHPFEVPGVEFDLAVDDGDGAEDAGRGDGTPAGRPPVLYMIGIVDRASLSDEALRLRLSVVVDALLLLGVLFTSFAMLWLWTAGDRLVLFTRHFVLVLATGLLGALLYTLFGMHLVSRGIDANALDHSMATVSHRLREGFAQELQRRLADLAVATEEMLSGDYEAEAAASSPVLRERFYCRPRGGWPPDDEGDGARYWRFPPFDLAFLLDDDGRQTRCLSYRIADTPPLTLSFRDYFRRPREGRLWWPPAAAPEGADATRPFVPGPIAGQSTGTPTWPGDAPRFFIERITSVLDNTTETALSARPEDLCAPAAGRSATGEPAPPCRTDAGSKPPVAVLIGRFQSLEEPVLPPHFRFAVFDDATGETLFHTVRSRALATNFLRQIDGDASLLALVRARSSGFVDLDYHGTSIRAFVQPVAEDVPWTLVVYRGRELEDTVGVMAVSLTTVNTIGAWTLLLAVLGALWLVRGRESVIRLWPWRSCGLPQLEAARRGLLILAASAAVILGVLAFVWPRASGLAAMATLVAAPIVLAWAARHGARPGRPAIAGHALTETGEERTPLAVTVLLLIVVVAVLPATGWYQYQRVELSAGLGDYLRDETLAAIETRCARHREYARRYKRPFGDIATSDLGGSGLWDGAFDHGWTLAPVEDGAEQRARAEPLPQICSAFSDAGAHRERIVRALDFEAREGGRAGAPLVRGMAGFSLLAEELFERSSGIMPRRDLRSTGAVFEALVEPERTGFLGRLDLGTFVLLAFVLIVGGAFAGAVVVSLIDRIIGVKLRLALLPEARLDRLPTSWVSQDAVPLRACALHRSDALTEALVAQLVDARFGSARYARFVSGDEGRVVWDVAQRERLRPAPVPAEEETDDDADAVPAAARPVLYVVDGLERMLLEEAARDTLLRELERLVAADASILLCTRVMPGFWLARMSESVAGDVVNVSRRAALTTRWAHVIGPFDVRRLSDGLGDREASFERALETHEARWRGDPEFAAVRDLMLAEAEANPELLDLAAGVTRQVTQPDFAAPGSRANSALQRFAAVAAGNFHEIWAASTREERLQLYALARGGFVNPTETVVLSSLANRGLVSIDGIVQLRSRAFGNFVVNDLVHDALLAWRDEGHGNVWRSIWPPIVILVVLAMAFFVSSTPEALAPLAALLAAGLGAVPVVNSLLRSVREFKGAGDGG